MCPLYTFLHGRLASCPAGNGSLDFNGRHDIPTVDQSFPLPRLYALQNLDLYKHMTSTLDTFLPSFLSPVAPATVSAILGTAVAVSHTCLDVARLNTSLRAIESYNTVRFIDLECKAFYNIAQLMEQWLESQGKAASAEWKLQAAIAECRHKAQPNQRVNERFGRTLA